MDDALRASACFDPLTASHTGRFLSRLLDSNSESSSGTCFGVLNLLEFVGGTLRPRSRSAFRIKVKLRMEWIYLPTICM